jgi:hypothetical protein
VAAEAPEPAEAPERSRGFNPFEVGAVLALIALAVGIVEYLYSQAPVPPGVDPGDWIQRSYAWVGLAHPPIYAVGSPYLYPPTLFPILGVLRLATGSPLTTGFVFGGLVLVLYGLTLWHLSRVIFTLPALRVAAVAVGLLNGTVLSMLFWGAYPNFLAFVVMNETIAFLIIALRTRRVAPTILTWGFASLTFLTHTLSFDLLAAAIVLAFLFAVLLKLVPWRYLVSPQMLVGVAILALTYGSYTAALDYLHVPRINYLFANPATFVLSSLGTMFGPLSSAPTILPAGAAFLVSNTEVAAILATSGLLALVLTLALVHWRPGRFEPAVLATGLWSAVMLLAPVGGYVAHVDTDYPRFVYFLPLPLTLFALSVFEGSLPRSTLSDPGPTSPASSPVPAPAPSRYRLLRPRPFRVLLGGLVAIGVAALVVNVSIPTVISADSGTAHADHDSEFVAAARYLAANPAPGSVFTVQGIARWVEALTDRGAFDPGPTWLEFEDWEVSNAEESYFAMNSVTGVTNNLVAASYSGYATTAVSEAPLVTAMVEGVPIPILRVVPGSEQTNSSGPGCSGWTSASASGTPILTLPGPTPESAVIAESNPCASIVQTTVLSPTQPTMWLNLTITPQDGAALYGFNLTLASPATTVGPLHAANVTAINTTGGQMLWNITTIPGQYPGGTSLQLRGNVVPSPVSVTSNATNRSGIVQYEFRNPSPTQAMSISFVWTVPGTSNPAVVLPTTLSTAQFFAANDIRFLFLPSGRQFAQTIDLLATTFGFVTVYSNSEWIIEEAP